MKGSFYLTIPTNPGNCSVLPKMLVRARLCHDGRMWNEGLAQSYSPRDRVRLIQLFTLAWMTFEALASLAIAWRAHSAALLAFGGDSLIELLSAAVVLWRFSLRDVSERTEQRTAQIAGALLVLLAVYVAVISTLALLGYREPRPTLFGICVLAAAVIVMPWLAWEKRKLSAATGSGALRADAAESGLCGYLALIALVGLLCNFLWGLDRADSFAAIALIPFILYEAREALRGKPCVCKP